VTRVVVAATLVVLISLGANARSVQTGKPVEYEVKAAFLYNFSKFVKWPAAALRNRNEFTICVIGRDPFGTSLDMLLAGETVDGKRVVARRIAGATDTATCEIAFISVSEERRLKETLATLARANTLTVSDIPQFAQRGGMIEFILSGNKVRFDINLTPAERSGLTLGSDLLRVAESVKRNPED
jgi:hypothetical protein